MHPIRLSSPPLFRRTSRGQPPLATLVTRCATVDGTEARVLAGSEPEPAFARPVRDPHAEAAGRESRPAR